MERLEFVHNNNDPSGAKMFNAPSIMHYNFLHENVFSYFGQN